MQTDAQFIASKLDTLIQKAGHTVERGAEFAWPILVRQQIVEGWVSIAAAVTLCLFAGVFIMLYRDSDDEVFGLLGGILTVIAAIAVVVAALQFPGLLNPEYGALQDILSTVR